MRSGRASEPPPLSGAGAAQPADPLIGQVLVGRYLIQRKLGEGGMGAVYVALHTLLEKQVALKILHGEFARKPDLVERFMQEAKAASRIRHENVIDISDFGATPEGLVFFAMELLQGHDLHDEIARHRLGGVRMPWSRSRPIFLQICSALSAAHAQGVVHRDLKPENIYLVEWLGHPDFVKLLDFGIAKLTELSDSDRKLTRTGMLFGTPEYMSPEQARGEHADHRVDVYAMGCILYQLVVGRVPFEADNFMGVLSRHLTEEPPRIPPGIFQEVGAPQTLWDVIAAALVKDRERRYQTIDDLSNAIRALHGEAPRPVVQPPRPREQRPPPKWSDEPPPGTLPPPTPAPKWPWLVVGLVVAAAAVGAAVLASRGNGATEAVAVADAGAVEPPALDAAIVVTPVPIDAAPALPARVTLRLTSTPSGADVIDGLTEQRLGRTPIDLDLVGSQEPRRFTLRLRGHAPKIVELVPVEDAAYEVVLRKGRVARGAEPVVEVVPPGARSEPRDAGVAGAPIPRAGAPVDAAVRTTTPEPVARPDAAPPPPPPDAAAPAARRPDATDSDDDDGLELKEWPDAAVTP